MARLLLRPLLLLLPVLLRRPVLLRLLLLRSAFRRLWGDLRPGLRFGRQRLRLCRRCFAGLLRRTLFASVILDVDDATLCIERRRNVLAVTLSAAAATTAAVAPEAAASATATLTFLVLPVLLCGAVAVHGRVGVAWVVGSSRS